MNTIRKTAFVVLLLLTLAPAGVPSAAAKGIDAGPGGELTVTSGADSSVVRIRSTRFR